MRKPEVAAVIVAAGRGLRMGGTVPKQFLPLGGLPVLARTVNAFLCHPLIDLVVVVVNPDDENHARTLVRTHCATADEHRLRFTGGGATRQLSVAAGLEALADAAVAPEGVVLIHDAARPLLSQDLITRAIDAARLHGAAVPALRVADTIKQLGSDGCVSGTLDRQALRAIQTPQSFRLALAREAHAAAGALADALDDAALVERMGHKVHVFEGETAAMKLTTSDDFLRAEALIGQAGARLETRAGTGFDVHAFVPGDHVVLGGVRIPHDQALSGHSDADVLLHALTDAILGAIGDGDIGQHFPPSDMRWRGADSALFLADAVARVAARGGRLVNLDGTLLCEAPRVGPHREAMRARIAEIAGIELDRVGVKATTTEKLGFTGRREGIAAMASAMVELPLRPGR